MDWKALINVDLPSLGPITEKTREIMSDEATRYRGSVRTATGRVWTDEEFAERKRRVLAKRLP